MSSEERLVRLREDGGGSNIERRLLASVADDEMPEENYRALLKWGAGLGAISAAPPAETASKLTLAKGLGVLALTAASIGVFGYVTASTTPPAAPSSDVDGMSKASATGAAVAAGPSEPSAPTSADAIPVVSLDELPSAPVAMSPPPNAAPARSAETRPLVDDDVSFTEQMKLIDSARTMLRQDNPRGALAVLDEYDRRFPMPAFKEEATVLRVSSLAKAGDRAHAKRIGEAFLSAHPSELYSRRVEAVVRALDAQEGTP
jgi:hypothetical protein